MRIAIVNPVHRRFSGGYFKYLAELVPRMAVDRRVSSLSVWLPGGVDAPAGDLPLRRWRGGMATEGLTELRRGLADERPDAILIPTARHLDLNGTPAVVMVRNMEPLRVPFGGNDPGEALRNIARAASARLACARAARVIAVSEHVRDFLHRMWRVRPARIGVVYHGVTAPSGRPAPPAFAQEIGSRPFIFTAGSLRAARGLEDLLESLPALAREAPDLAVVVAGRWDPGSTRYRRRITALAERLGMMSRITWAGHLEADGIAWALANARVFVMTTRAEACPNTALEALSHGCSIASTAEPPMREFLADTALYYEPRRPVGLADAILRLHRESPAQREHRREASMARSRAFDWSATVNGTIEQLAIAASRPVAPGAAA